MHSNLVQNARMDFDDRPDPAQRLEQARIARGFATAKDACAFFGWNYATYTQHENGLRGLGRQSKKYADALRVSEAWLLTGEGAGPDGQVIAPPRPVIIPGRDLVAQNGETLPVYAAARGGDGHTIVTFDEIERVKMPAVLQGVKGGYGLLVAGDSMVPVFHPGDTLLVHPHLQPARGYNHVFYHHPPHGGEEEAVVKELVAFNDREWSLKQWNPIKEWKESRQVWQTCHRIVGKYDRR